MSHSLDILLQHQSAQSADALAWRARDCAAAGRLADAADCWRAVIGLRPDLAAAHNNLGSTLRLLRQDDEAALCFRAALRLDADYPEACNNLGTLLCEQGRPADGEALLRRAVALRPDYARAHYNLGKTLLERGHIAEARDCFRTAVRHEADFAEAHVHLAHLLLLQGALPEGWVGFEWRLRLPGVMPPLPGVPLWRGEPLDGRTLLLRASQGIGDIIQFCRYVPLLAPVGRVVLQVQPPLQRLLHGLADGVAVISTSDPAPACDLQCDLLSLPYIFGTGVETIPAQIPYLHARPNAVAYWHGQLNPLGSVRVGLVWAGNPAYAADRKRSIGAEHLAALAGIPGITFVSLQIRGERPPIGLNVYDPTAMLGDFADTAALIEALDLVIGVDTAVVHLAGALGKPVWLLNRFDTDWRWMRDRSDSPWYPTLRQFRQTRPGDWDTVLQEVRQALHDLPQRLGSEADAAFQEALRHHQAERLPDAERCYRKVLTHWLDHFPSMHQLGLIALRYRKPEAAIELFSQAVRHCPEEPAIVNNLGNAFRDAGCPAEAAVCFRESLRLRPSDPKTLTNLAIALADLGDITEAEAICRECLALQPDLPDLHLALGSMLLAAGRMTEGWPEFAWRRRIPIYQARSLPGAEWQGEPFGDSTLLLYADEGIGDAIQFIRYLPLVRGRRVVVEVQPELVRLFRLLMEVPGLGVVHVAAVGEALPPIQLHRPLLDLPGLLHTTLDTIPADVPYLWTDPALALRWHRRLDHLPGFRVGIAWAGNPMHFANGMRSISLARLAPLFAAFPDVNFISLQKGEPRRQIAELEEAARLHDFTDELKDFADTAALISSLDLVIAVDTAVVHLAGALAVPVWMLNRFNTDWRWQRHRDDSPWYPTLRQFRQVETGNWDGVVDAVVTALRETLAEY